MCADPNNLPFSNQAGERIREPPRKYGCGRTRVEGPLYLVRAATRLHSHHVVVGMPSTFELVQVTRPYYRSTYVFVTRADRDLGVRSFDDPVLEPLRIGVHTIGDDYANAPPAHALARRGVIQNVHGFSIYGDYSSESSR